MEQHQQLPCISSDSSICGNNSLRQPPLSRQQLVKQL
jgi:hypothetical protein